MKHKEQEEIPRTDVPDHCPNCQRLMLTKRTVVRAIVGERPQAEWQRRKRTRYLHDKKGEGPPREVVQYGVECPQCHKTLAVTFDVWHAFRQKSQSA